MKNNLTCITFNYCSVHDQIIVLVVSSCCWYSNSQKVPLTLLNKWTNSWYLFEKFGVGFILESITYTWITNTIQVSSSDHMNSYNNILLSSLLVLVVDILIIKKRPWPCWIHEQILDISLENLELVSHWNQWHIL